MKYLLDTHILFWAMSAEEKLPSEIISIINNPENDIYFSTASVWEVVIKNGKDPAKMPVDGISFTESCLEADFIPLPIINKHVLAVSGLRRGEGEPIHNDPFDKVLIAQAKTESMIFITHDNLLTGYSEKCILKI